jgi:hypothetical protein
MIVYSPEPDFFIYLVCPVPLLSCLPAVTQLVRTSP